MAVLVRFDAGGQWGETLVCEERVAQALREHGLDHGQWPLRALGDGSLGAVRAVYAGELAGLRDPLQVTGIERLELRPRQAGWRALRAAFNAEQVQDISELRYFLGGTALFYFPVPGGYLALFCDAQDWVAVPAGTAYSFDAGLRPQVHALRLFSAASQVAPRAAAPPTHARRPALPPLDDFVEELLALTGHDEY